MAALAWAEDNSASTATSPAGPPKAKVDVVEETIHGHKIADPYRWLEDASSPPTRRSGSKIPCTWMSAPKISAIELRWRFKWN